MTGSLGLITISALAILCHFATTQASNSKRILWDSKTIEQELHSRQERQQLAIENKLNEAKLYISKNNLQAASSVMTILKAGTTTRNDTIHYVDSYLDFRLGRYDSALRTLKKITSSASNIQLKKCFLWLKIAWDTNRWQEVSNAFNQCESILSHYSSDELFYTKNLYNLSVNVMNESTISPSPFFYYYAPDYQKIEQWLSLLIKKNHESIALKHLRRIPDESLAKGNVKLLTTMALWNANDKEYAQNLAESIPDFQKADWNYLRLMSSIALSKNNWQLAWDTNNRVLDQKPNLLSAQSLDILLGWQMNIIELIKIKQLQKAEIFEYDRELTPLAAGMLFIKGLKQEAQNLLQKYPPDMKSSQEHQLGHWVVKQWISIRNNQMATFMNDAVDSCQKQVSFGCWLLLSSQSQNNVDKTEIFPYDSVGEYFRKQL